MIKVRTESVSMAELTDNNLCLVRVDRNNYYYTSVNKKFDNEMIVDKFNSIHKHSPYKALAWIKDNCELTENDYTDKSLDDGYNIIDDGVPDYDMNHKNHSIQNSINYSSRLNKYLNNAGLTLTSDNCIIGPNMKINKVLAGFEKKYNCKVEISTQFRSGEYIKILKGIVSNA